jgi:ComF family protein
LPNQARRGIEKVAAGFFNLLFPDECRLCEEPLRNASRIPVCPSCLSNVKPLEAAFFCRLCRTPFVDSYPLDEYDLCTICRENTVSFDAAYSFGSYDGTLRDLIHLFKYARIETLAAPLGRLMVNAIPRDEQFDMVQAMPIHWSKRWERGFNQAELLAKPVASRYGVGLSKGLQRVTRGKPQAGLDYTERLANLKSAFRVTRPQQVTGKRVLLVDDVFTTGATLRAAAAALKEAGARRVSALTLARVDRRREDAPSGRNAKRAHAATSFGSNSLNPPPRSEYNAKPGPTA